MCCWKSHPPPRSCSPRHCGHPWIPKHRRWNWVVGEEKGSWKIDRNQQLAGCGHVMNHLHSHLPPTFESGSVQAPKKDPVITLGTRHRCWKRQFGKMSSIFQIFCVSVKALHSCSHQIRWYYRSGVVLVFQELLSRSVKGHFSKQFVLNQNFLVPQSQVGPTTKNQECVSLRENTLSYREQLCYFKN